MNWAIRDTRTGEYVVAAYRNVEVPSVFTAPDGALMYGSEQAALDAMREFGLDEGYEAVRV